MPGDLPQLIASHLEQLQSGSGLSDETVADAGLFSVTDGEVARRLLNWHPGGDAPPVPALAIPYPEDGTYVRLRPDSPRLDDRGEPIKYESPVGHPQRLYIPAMARAALAIPGSEIFIVEGEKKALAVNQAGIPAIAVGGVYGFHDAAARKAAKQCGEDTWPPLPQIALLAGHPVTVVFDSDIDRKAQVMRALGVAGRIVGSVAPATNVGFLDSAPDGSKIGADDLYVRLNRDALAFRDIVFRSRRPTLPSEGLRWMAERWSGWNETQREVELRRALTLFLHLLTETDFNEWKRQAGSTLHPPKGLIKRIENDHRRDLRRRPRQARDWMTAPGYTVTDDGVYQEPVADDRHPKLIAPAPINIAEVGRDEDGVHYATLRYAYGDENLSVTVPRLQVANQDLLKIASRGAPVTLANRSNLQEFLVRQERANLSSIPRIRFFTRFGWSIDFLNYALGRHVIGGGGGRVITEADERFLNALNPGGSLRDYLEVIHTVMDASYEAEAAVAAGYAPPLLRLLGLRSLLLSYWGDSHGGKSASQAAAVSPWGSPHDLMLTGDVTPTALEANLARCRDIITWIDDTQQTRSRALLENIAYQVGGGKGRARGTADGSIRPIANWLSIGFVSGEHPLLKFGAAAGARNRSLELKVCPMTRELAAQVHVALSHHHGMTGPAFIEELIERFIRPNRIGDLSRVYEQYVKDVAVDSADQSGRYIALLGLADHLARLFVFGDSESSARSAALAMARGLVALCREQRDTGVDPVEAGYETIVAWVVENDSCFREEPARSADSSGRSPRRRLGAFVDPQETDGRRVVAILPEPLREAMEKASFNVQEVLHGLLERDRLIPGEADERGSPRLGKKIQIGGDRTRAYWIVLPATEDPSGGDGAPRDFKRPGQSPGPEVRSAPQGVTISSPTVPPIPAQHLSVADATGVTSDARTRVCNSGTAGTVGQTDLSSEEREEIAGACDDPPPVPPLVPPDVPVGQPSPSRVTVITDHASAHRACLDLARQPLLFLAVDLFTPTASSKARSRRKRNARSGQPRASAIRYLHVVRPDSSVGTFDVQALGGVPPSLAAILSRLPIVGFDLTGVAPELIRQFGISLAHPIDLKAAWVLSDGYAGLPHDERLFADACSLLLGAQTAAPEPWDSWSERAVPQEQIQAAAVRVSLLVPLHAALTRRVAEAGVQGAWDIENGVVTPLAHATVRGMGIDADAVQRLIDECNTTMARLAPTLNADLGPIRFGSDKEVKAAVLERHAITLPGTDESTLKAHANLVPVLTELIAFRRARRQATTFQGWLDAIGPDGRVHPTCHPLAAVTGRMSYSDPALQQVPRAPEIRACFVPASGNKLIIGDYSMSQLRIAAEVTGDPEMIRCFKATPEIDLHRRTASEFSGTPYQEISEQQRKHAKAINFGLLFKMTPYGLVYYAMDTYGVELTLDDAEAAHSVCFSLYPGLAAWHAWAERQAPVGLCARTKSGRLRVLTATDPRLVHRFLCTPIQGTEADAFKRALALIHPLLAEIGAFIVNTIHDELIVESPAHIAERALEIVRWGMKAGMEEYLKVVPVRVDARIADAWVKA